MGVVRRVRPGERSGHQRRSHFDQHNSNEQAACRMRGSMPELALATKVDAQVAVPQLHGEFT